MEPTWNDDDRLIPAVRSHIHLPLMILESFDLKTSAPTTANSLSKLIPKRESECSSSRDDNLRSSYESP